MESRPATGPRSMSTAAPAGKPAAGFGPGKLIEQFKKLTKPAKAGILALILLTVVACAAIGHYEKAQAEVPLYSAPLGADDFDEITTKLTQLGFTFHVSGGKILVPPAKRAAIQRQLLLYGYPRHPLSEPSAAGAGFPKTSEEQREDFRIRLEGELTGAIRQIEGVADAYVSIVLSNPGPFSDEARPSTASVLLKLRPSAHINQYQADGIISMAVHSVPNLVPEKVSLTDTKGRRYAWKGGGPAANIDDPDTRRTAFEKHKQDEIQRELDRILGPDRASVLITAEFDSSTRTEESVIHPGAENGRVRVLEKVRRETFDRTDLRKEDKKKDDDADQMGFAPMGIPLESVKRDEAVNYDKSEHNTKWETDTRHVKSTTPPGNLKRLCVAIAVSNLKPLEEAAILNYVKTGSGINEERGDTITISNIPFRQPPTIIPFPEGGQAVQPSGGPWPWALAFFPAFALLAFLALFLTRHRKAQTEKAQLVSATAPHAVASDIADLISDRTGRSHKTGATRANRTEDFVRLANERPDRVAEALRSTWLNRN